MLDQNVLRLDVIHPSARRNQTVVLPPPNNSSEANVFAAAILDDTTTHRRRPLDLAISLAFHGGLLTVVLLLPLFFSSKLDVHVAAATFLVAPMPPRAAPPAPPPAAMPRAPQTPPKEIFTPGKLTAPSFVPKKVTVTADDVAPPPDQAMGGVPERFAGRNRRAEAPLRGFLNVAARVPSAPPQPIAEGPKKPIRVGTLTASTNDLRAAAGLPDTRAPSSRQRHRCH